MFKLLPALLITTLLMACDNQAVPNAQETPCYADIIYTSIDYYPTQREGVSDKTYRIAINALKNTYQAIIEDDSTFTYMDHMNLFNAFAALHEPKVKVTEQLLLAQEKDLEHSSEIFILTTKKERFARYFSSNEYDSMYHTFDQIVKTKKVIPVDLGAYSIKGGLDVSLVRLMVELKNKDQEYRKSDNEDFYKQNIIDEQNILIVDSLYNEYGSYIGTSLIGEEYNYIMWAVIQHSDLSYQEYYLPTLYKAVINNELHEGPFHMLVDRVYTRKYGYQIFGSQSGIDLGSEDEIKKVKNKYKYK